MRILVVTPRYPNKYRSDFPFVKQMVDELARQGHECCVIAPHNKSHNMWRGVPYREEYLVDGQKVVVFRPWHVSTSDLWLFGRHITTILHCRAVSRVLRDLCFEPDIIYCHFWRSVAEIQKYAEQKKIPLFVGNGENNIVNGFEEIERYRSLCKKVDGVISVSTKNKDESIALGLATEEKCRVFLNGIDNNLFNVSDQREARRLLGLPVDKFIIAFVGSYNKIKGPDRLSAAIQSIKEKDVYSLFIGEGPIKPSCENILFKGPLLHEQIPLYLNVADIFVLPTRAEGCCNAIIEAMACGLPIVSSDLPFNKDILNEKNAILIDPDDIEAIARAICYLRDNREVRERMAQECLKSAEKLTISERVRGIVEFMNDVIKTRITVN